MSVQSQLFRAIETKNMTALEHAFKLIEFNAASHTGANELCKELPKEDIDQQDTINAVDKNGKTALMRAAELGWEEGVVKLLERKADHNIKDNYGRTVLHYAAQSKEGNQNIFTTLLKLFPKKAESKSTSPEETKANPTSSVEEKTFDPQLLNKALREIHPIDQHDKHGMTPCMYAALGLHTGIVNTLMAANADVSLVCPQFDYPSSKNKKSQKHGHLSALHFAIDSELDVSRPEGKDDRETRRTETVAALLTAPKTDVEMFDQISLPEAKQGQPASSNRAIFAIHRTSLQKAAAANQAEVVALLLANRANPYKLASAPNPLLMIYIHEYPLVLAARNLGDPERQRQTVENLLKIMQGPLKRDLTLFQEIIQEAFEIAVHHCRPLIMDLLIKAGAKFGYLNEYQENIFFNVVLEQNVNEQDRVAAFKVLMSNNLDLTLRSNYRQMYYTTDPDRLGQTILITAAKYGRTGIVELILQSKKVDLNAQDAQGYTALSWAAEQGHVGVVQALLSADPAPKLDLRLNDGSFLRRIEGSTVFHAAGRSNESAESKINALLVEAACKQKQLHLLECKNSDGLPQFVDAEQKALQQFELYLAPKNFKTDSTSELESNKDDNLFKKLSVRVIQLNQRIYTHDIVEINQIFDLMMHRLHKDYEANDNSMMMKAICILKLGHTRMTQSKYTRDNKFNKKNELIECQNIIDQLMRTEWQFIRSEFGKFIDYINDQQYKDGIYPLLNQLTSEESLKSNPPTNTAQQEVKDSKQLNDHSDEKDSKQTNGHSNTVNADQNKGKADDKATNVTATTSGPTSISVTLQQKPQPKVTLAPTPPSATGAINGAATDHTAHQQTVPRNGGV